MMGQGSEGGRVSNKIVAFLRARLDEREAAARDTLGTHVADSRKVWEYDGDRTVSYGNVVVAQDPANGYPRNGKHIALNDPAYVLADIAAKRDMVNRYFGALFTQRCHPEDEGNNGYVVALSQVLQLLAALFADHPDFRPEWRLP